jgi:Putative peptidoglycan binding domain
MKSLLFASIVSVSLALSVQAGDRRGRNGNSQGVARARGSAPTMHVNSGFRYGGNRAFASSPRMTTRSMPTFSQRRILSNGNTPILHRQFTSRTFSGGNGSGLSRFESNRLQSNRLSELQGQRGNRFAQLGTGGGGNRTVGNISPGHNHVFAQRSGDWHRDWDRHHDHWWNGHRCRFVNGSWFIFDIGFIPWFGWPYYDYYAYDYYPYGYPYGYDQGPYQSSYYYGQNGYDASYYDQGGSYHNDQSNYYDQGNSNSYDQGGNGLGSNERATVADVQDQLTRAGYYHGQIDGVLGPETRHALVRYQSDKGLRVTGSLTMETQQSLGIAQGGDQITDQ